MHTHTAVSSEETHTHTRTHTHTEASQCSGAWWTVGGSVPCSTVSLQLWYWGWRERWTFTPPTYNPCRTRDSNPRPLGYKPNSLSIRTRLAQLYSCSSCYPHWLILIYSYVVIYTIIHKKGTKLSLGWYLLNGIPLYLKSVYVYLKGTYCISKQKGTKMYFLKMYCVDSLCPFFLRMYICWLFILYIFLGFDLAVSNFQTGCW